MSEIQNFKSHIKYYRIIWIIILVILLAVKFLVYNSASKTQLFALSVISLLIIWLPLMLVNYLERSRMNNFLYKYYFDEEGDNSSRDLRSLKDKSQDPVANAVKENSKALRKFVYSVFFSIIILLLIIMML